MHFSSGHGLVSALVNDVTLFLQHEGLQPGMIEDAAIALAEALNNVEEHAYEGQAGFPVCVKITASPTHFQCVIEDQGTPIPGQTLPGDQMPFSDPSAPEKLPEGGFGWALLHRLTRDLNYARTEQKNLLSFSIL